MSSYLITHQKSSEMCISFEKVLQLPPTGASTPDLLEGWGRKTPIPPSLQLGENLAGALAACNQSFIEKKYIALNLWKRPYCSYRTAKI